MARKGYRLWRSRRSQLEMLEPRLPLSGDPMVLDPDEVGWASVRNLTSAQFSDDFDARKDTQIMLDIEVDEVNGQQRVSAVWQDNTENRGWEEHRNLTSSQFGDIWQQRLDAGYRLIDQESYVLGGQRYYAGIWIENTEGYAWASYRNVTSAEFSERFDQYQDNYIMIDFEAYTVGESTLYAAAWVENADNLAWVERRGLTSQEFSDYFDQYKDFYRVHDIESYQINGQQRYAAIWVENRNDRNWVEFRDMDADGYRNRWLHYRDLGYRLTDFEQYETNNGIRYAGVWRQNSDRPDWQFRTTIDAITNAHLGLYDIPGLSVAIVYQGEILYMRGFGDQDVASDKWYSARTINRLASVSKAVAGVLLTKLAEDGDVDPSADTRDYVPTMPVHQTHTLEQLASNRGGVGHYDELGLGTVNTQYDTALEAAALFWNDPLVAAPGTQYFYSTHGYTLLGAAIEGATGEPIDDVLESELGPGIGLPTLKAEDRSVASEFRTTLYNSDNSVATPDNISWKILGGGIEASAYDLVRFSALLMGGQILSEDGLQQLWTVPQPDNVQYASGWNLGTQQGHFSVRKDGEQRGANTYLRLFPDLELGIVVLSNRRDTAPGSLSFDIAEAILPTLALPGDYNDDGVVDAADYVVWRMNEGTRFELPNRDPTVSGVVGPQDYQVWRNNFGAVRDQGITALTSPLVLGVHDGNEVFANLDPPARLAIRMPSAMLFGPAALQSGHEVDVEPIEPSTFSSGKDERLLLVDSVFAQYGSTKSEEVYLEVALHNVAESNGTSSHIASLVGLPNEVLALRV